MDMVITNLQQQRQITEQLRREAALKRITVSKAVEDIMKYITEHEQEDCLLMSNTSSTFSVSLVTLDSYQSTPLPELDVTYSEFRGTDIKHVPVIRIFGSTTSGEKTCLHVHGVFPYIYVPCAIENNVNGFMYKLSAAIDSALNVSLGSGVSTTQHVYKIQLVSGIPLYGYHEKEHLFFKIYFYNPTMIKRAAELLQNGTILNQSLQPHEAHIPFILQFMIDYNLYGMSLVRLSHVKFRQFNCAEPKEAENSSGSFDSLKYLPRTIVRQSTCKLEIDAQATEILNRQDIENGLDLNPGIASIWNEEKCRRDAKGLENADSQLLYTNTENRMYGPTENDIYQEEKLEEKIQYISEIDESVTPVTPSTLSYPLETRNEDNLSHASVIVDHFKPLSLIKENKQEILLSDESLELEKSILKENLSKDKSIEGSPLDIEDMRLVEILANLAEANDEEKIVDTDSMLGSQFSACTNQMKEESEDDEIEDLNITSLDLDSLSSWNSATKAPNQLSAPETENRDIEVHSEHLSGDIPQLDGPNDLSDSCSESEVEHDFTVERQETQICAYKSRTKSGDESNVVSLSRKRKFKLQGSDSEFPRKRRNINSDLSNEQHRTPTKVRMLQSPRSLSKKYSPLNVKIISPKTDKSTRRKDFNINESFISKSSCDTPKRNPNTKELIGCDERGDINQTFLLDKFNDNTDVSEESSIGLEEEPFKSAKEVRKKLDFIDENEVDVAKNEDNKKCHLDNTVLTGNIVSELPENIINDEHNIPSTSKGNVDSYRDGFENGTLVPNEDIEDEDEEDICNMTYTQYLNRKLETESNNTPNTRNSLSLGSTSDIAKTKLIVITTKFNPPSRERIINSMRMYGCKRSKYVAPFFSNRSDLTKQKECSTKINDVAPFKCCLDRVTGIRLWRRVKINEFYPSGASIKSCDIKRALAGYNSLIIHPLVRPPTPKDVRTWLQAKEYLLKKSNKQKERKDDLNIANDTTDNQVKETCIDDKEEKRSSQNSNDSEHSSGLNDNVVNSSLRKMLENPLLHKNNTPEYLGISYGQIEYSMKGQSGSVTDENLRNARGITVHQCLTLLSVEVHVITEGKLLPNPEHDAIEAIFYAIYADVPLRSKSEQIEHGAIVVSSNLQNEKIANIYSTSTGCPMSYVSSEQDLLNSFLRLIRHSDPDILLGWEIESLSWGYIFHRASRIGFDHFMWQISRISNATPPSKGQIVDKESLNDPKVSGRIVLDVWRIMRHEIALLNYTFENVMYNVMRERISCPSFQTLTNWWKHNSKVIQWRVVTHYVIRVVGTLRILMHLDIIGRTCQHARLIGIQFYEIFSRGSQFRVESMMLRLGKPLNYIPVSPSIHQRAKMRAPQALPLIMEPQSVFYTDPLIVLDFQSLYPSIIIAYNYCFSTCLGRIEHIGHNEPFEFGATTLRVKKSTMKKLKGKINFSPCGVAFVKPEVRLGILPRMLTEILNTRLMVKKSMQLHGNENQTLQRVLHSQQLGLKLIANVTYGYTSANFSGRMPCIEIGDSVVSKGRETLERAIKMVESTAKWGAQVVYGDTDSLFILLPGKSRQDAFVIGAEIADTVTAANPPPVKLKFEKILQPSILQTKKRYCGYMYETSEQKEPEYLAKGIETVRRDGCPAVAKILEKSLKILFDTKDVSLVKLYVTRQFDKILRQKISIQDLTFAKEFRGLRGYKPSACVPALELTKRLMKKDPRAVPRTGERVRYVIVAGAPNQPLIHCVRAPMEVILEEGLNPNSVYYITKVIIPPLNRCFNLIGIDVNTWYREMSHRQTFDKAVSLFADNQKLTIRQFFSTVMCVACGNQTQKDICTNCIEKPNQTVTILHEKLRWLERTYHELVTICQSCTGYMDEPNCESLDCTVLYRLAQARRDLIQLPYLNQIVSNIGSLYIERTNMKH